MKGTRSTRILATVFHKHKHITNTDVTPEDCVIAAAGKLAYDLKGRITLHLSESTLDQLKLIWAILKKGWKKTVQQHPPSKNPTPPPPPPHQTPKPVTPVTLVISPTGPPTRVTPPRVETPRVVPPPKVVPPPRAEDPVTPRRSPQLAALRNYIKDEVDVPSRKTRRQTGKRRSTTQDSMLEAVTQLKITPAHLAQQNFPI